MRCDASRAAVAVQFDQLRTEIAAAPVRLIAPLPDSRLAPPRANRNNAFAQILEAYESGKLKSVSAAKTAERAARKNQLVEVAMVNRSACSTGDQGCAAVSAPWLEESTRGWHHPLVAPITCSRPSLGRDPYRTCSSHSSIHGSAGPSRQSPSGIFPRLPSTSSSRRR